MESNEGIFVMNRQKRTRLALIMLLLAVSFGTTSCSLLFGKKGVDPTRTDVAMIYGYIDMDDAPGPVDWVRLMRAGASPLYYTAGAKDGYFWHVGVDTGPYQIYNFGTNESTFQRARIYNFGSTRKNRSATRAEEPGLHFMGSYKYVTRQKSGLFKQGKFSIEKNDEVSEKQVLEQILKKLKKDRKLRKYVHQIGWIEKRLDTLK